MLYNKILLSCFLIASIATPTIFANDFTRQTKESNIISTQNKLQDIQCSGRCETCSDQNCPVRRKQYKGNK